MTKIQQKILNKLIQKYFKILNLRFVSYIFTRENNIKTVLCQFFVSREMSVNVIRIYETQIAAIENKRYLKKIKINNL